MFNRVTNVNPVVALLITVMICHRALTIIIVIPVTEYIVAKIVSMFIKKIVTIEMVAITTMATDVNIKTFIVLMVKAIVPLQPLIDIQTVQMVGHNTVMAYNGKNISYSMIGIVVGVIVQTIQAG